MGIEWLIIGMAYLVALLGGATLLGRFLKRVRKDQERLSAEQADIERRVALRLQELEDGEEKRTAGRPATITAMMDLIDAMGVQLVGLDKKTETAISLGRSVRSKLGNLERWSDELPDSGNGALAHPDVIETGQFTLPGE